MKTKVDKRVNKITKTINRSLEKDIFGSRFWIRQYRKIKNDDMQYYLFELCDRVKPSRNIICKEGWLWGESNLLMKDLLLAVNNFIVTSDFWEEYNG